MTMGLLVGGGGVFVMVKTSQHERFDTTIARVALTNPK